MYVTKHTIKKCLTTVLYKYLTTAKYCTVCTKPWVLLKFMWFFGQNTYDPGLTVSALSFQEDWELCLVVFIVTLSSRHSC